MSSDNLPAFYPLFSFQLSPAMHIQYLLSVLVFFTVEAQGARIVISNDDGWAVAQIRAQYDSLRNFNHDVRSQLIPPYPTSLLISLALLFSGRPHRYR